MPKTRRLPDHIHVDHTSTECQECGLLYEEMSTGLTFAEVRQLMHVNSDNPEEWVYKRRNGVLGYWRMLKLEMWKEHVEACALHGAMIMGEFDDEPEPSNLDWMDSI